MKPLDLLKQAETMLNEYRYSLQNSRAPMLDLAIWQTLEMYYSDAEGHELVVTSTRDEAFERILADNWQPFQGSNFYGIDYEAVDELVLDYLIRNQLVTRVPDSL